MGLALELDQPRGDLAALPAQHVRVDQHAEVLHVEQHRHERLFDLLVQRLEPGQLLELRPQRAVQPQRHVGVLGGVFGGLLQRHLVERQLLRAFAGDVLVVDRLDAEVTQRGRVEVVPRGRAVQHIGLEHRVVADSAQLDPVVAQHVRVVLQVVAELRPPGVLEQRPQPLEHHRAV